MLKRLLSQPAVVWLLGQLVGLYLRLVLITSKIERQGVVPTKPCVFIHWHGRLMLFPLLRQSGIPLIGLISQNRDGQLIGSLINALNIQTVAGSTSKGGSIATRQLVKLGKAGASIALTPDGPRGPRHHLQAGGETIARLTKLPLQPVSLSMKKFWQINSWDRLQVPQPFNHLIIHYHAPIVVDKALTDKARTKLQTELIDQEAVLDASLLQEKT